MTTYNHRLRLIWCATVVLLGVGLLGSCSKPVAETSDPKAELLNSLKGVNVSGFEFSTKEDDTSAIAAFTNSAVQDLITFEKDTNNVVLQYARVKDKKANITKTYKTEVLRKNNTLVLKVSDLATNAVVSQDDMPPPPPPPPPDGSFNTLDECIRDFNCKHRGELECEANRTCKNQFAAIMCCLTNGQCFSVHFIIRPTSVRCQLIDLIPNLEGFVLRQ